MESSELHTRLLDDARRYDPAQHMRSLLAPYRDVLLVQRAKFMSYEQISATLARHGLRVSAAAVGVFCRKNLTKSEIEQARRQIPAGKPAAAQPVSRISTGTSSRLPSPREPGKRGPKIARDDF